MENTKTHCFLLLKFTMGILVLLWGILDITSNVKLKNDKWLANVCQKYKFFSFFIFSGPKLFVYILYYHFSFFKLCYFSLSLFLWSMSLQGAVSSLLSQPLKQLLPIIGRGRGKKGTVDEWMDGWIDRWANE